MWSADSESSPYLTSQFPPSSSFSSQTGSSPPNDVSGHSPPSPRNVVRPLCPYVTFSDIDAQDETEGSGDRKRRPAWPRETRRVSHALFVRCQRAVCVAQGQISDDEKRIIKESYKLFNTPQRRDHFAR